LYLRYVKFDPLKTLYIYIKKQPNEQTEQNTNTNNIQITNGTANKIPLPKLYPSSAATADASL